MVTSRYIQITDWLLVEYIYTANQPDNVNYDTSELGIYRINNAITGDYQFANLGQPTNGLHITGNCLDWSAIAINATQSKWASTKIGSGNNIFDVTPDITIDDVSANIANIHYDTLKLHILSGYNFEGLDGFVLEVLFRENSKKDFKAASFCFSADLTTQHITFNPNPIILAEKNYDKYLTFKVPALQYVQTEYWNNSSYIGNFAYTYSHPTVKENSNPGAYVKDSPIFINLHELIDVQTVDNVDYFTVKNKFSASIQAADTFSSLGCILKESDDGDYFEYFPSWQNTFIDNYISNLNSTGNNDWTVINELHVIEQIGVDTIQTSNFVQFQNDSYDVPNYYRPIIKNASTAFAFSIQYVMKFFNRATSEQIIRTANITSYDPKKYGKGLMNIAIDSSIAPVKVYNKVINLKRMQTSTLSASKPLGVTTKYVDVFIDKYNIAGNMSTIDASPNGTFYGQAQLVIYLTKFDNVFKFKLVKHQGNSYIPLNISTFNMYMNFILDNGQTLSLTLDKTSPATGEFTATIKSDNAQKLLKQKGDTNFYIISTTGTSSTQTVVYTGSYRDAKFQTTDLSAGDQSLLKYIKDKEAYLAEYERRLKLDHQTCESERAALVKLAKTMQSQLNAMKSAVSNLPAAQQQTLNAILPSSIPQVDNNLLVNQLVNATTATQPSSSNAIKQTPAPNKNTANAKTPPGGDNTQTNTTNGSQSLNLSKLSGLAGLAGLCGS